jgi:proteasome lid subunit RPN8/RPN11
VLTLGERHLEAIRRRARRAYPRECCGLLLGEPTAGGARVRSALPARNLDPAPRHGYSIDPRALLRGHRAARRHRLQVVGYYHSHPDSPPAPSRRDAAEALPGASYLILAVEGGAPAASCCFRRAREGAPLVAEELVVEELMVEAPVVA